MFTGSSSALVLIARLLRRTKEGIDPFDKLTSEVINAFASRAGETNLAKIAH
jgi:hypothetical protein